MRTSILGLAATVAAGLATPHASAAYVSYSWGVVITKIGEFKPLLPGMQGVKVGDKAIVTFTLDTGVQDIYQSPAAGGYPAGAINIRYRIPRIGYMFTSTDAMLEVTNSAPAFDLIRIEKPIPELNASFLIWLRSTNPVAVANQGVPLWIHPSEFDYTRYVGFYGTDGVPSAILGGDPSILSTCPADLNSDGQVDDSDFIIFVQAYDTLDCFDGAMPFGCPADLGYDGAVDDADFVQFAVAYNELVCP